MVATIVSLGHSEVIGTYTTTGMTSKINLYIVRPMAATTCRMATMIHIWTSSSQADSTSHSNRHMTSRHKEAIKLRRLLKKGLRHLQHIGSDHRLRHLCQVLGTRPFHLASQEHYR
jgi:hypothetical protein